MYPALELQVQESSTLILFSVLEETQFIFSQDSEVMPILKCFSNLVQLLQVASKLAYCTGVPLPGLAITYSLGSFPLTPPNAIVKKWISTWILTFPTLVFTLHQVHQRLERISQVKIHSHCLLLLEYLLYFWSIKQHQNNWLQETNI